MATEQIGGDIFTDVADLAIPFGFLVGVQGIKMIADRKKNASKKKIQHGGDGACFLCMEQQQGGARAKAMLRSEITKITGELRQLLADY